MTDTDTDTDEDGVELLSEYVNKRDMIDQEVQRAAHFNGLTTVQANIMGGVGADPHVYISRAAASGSYERLSADEARRMASEIRELAERDSALLRYFTAGGRDDPEEMADALCAAADALNGVEMIDGGFMSRLRYTLYEVNSDE